MCVLCVLCVCTVCTVCTVCHLVCVLLVCIVRVLWVMRARSFFWFLVPEALASLRSMQAFLDNERPKKGQ